MTKVPNSFFSHFFFFNLGTKWQKISHKDCMKRKIFFFRTRPVLSYFLFLLLLDQNNSIGYTIIDQICVWMERAAQQVHIWLRNMVIFFLFFKVSKGYESLVFLPTICSFLEEIRRLHFVWQGNVKLAPGGMRCGSPAAAEAPTTIHSGDKICEKFGSEFDYQK